MQLTLKTLKGDEFKVEVAPSDTVGALKAKIEAAKGDGYAAAGQKLIFAGKILSNDAQTIEASGIKETDFVVVMVTAKKATAAAPAAAPAPAPAPAPAQPAPAPATPAASAPAAASSGSAGAPTVDPSEAAVSQLMDMGFPRDQCQAALRAAFGDSSRAVEYLFNGIPEGLAAAPPQASAPAQQQEPIPADVADDDDGDASGDASGSGDGSGAGEPLSPSSPLAFLLQNDNFLQLLTVTQQNPALLPALLSQLAQANPDLVQLINQHRDDFYKILNTPVGQMGGGGGGGRGRPGPPGGQIQVTAEENEAIERLCALGFDKALVVQAYFACDKDENAAANFLMNMGD